MDRSSTLLKTLAIPSDTTVERSAVEREDLKSHWKLENVYNSGGDQHTYHTTFKRYIHEQE